MAASMPQVGSRAPVPVDLVVGSDGRAVGETGPGGWSISGVGERPELERAIHARLVAATEAERARIARELHDVVGQALTSVRLNLLSLDRANARTGASGAQIDDSLAAVDDALRQVRSAAFDLRPAVLDDLGLAAALRSLSRRVAERTGIAVVCRVTLPDGRLPAEIETTCYRVAQEAITNAVRHAGARRVRVDVGLRRRAGMLVLEVSDDGVGFDPAGCTGVACLGLSGMAERASLVGGSVEVRSTIGAGTRVIGQFGVDPLPGAPR